MYFVLCVFVLVLKYSVFAFRGCQIIVFLFFVDKLHVWVYKSQEFLVWYENFIYFCVMNIF